MPILLGVSPFGLIYGVMALSAGLPALLAIAAGMLALWILQAMLPR